MTRSASAPEAAEEMAEQIDSGKFLPSCELIEAISIVSAAIARWKIRQGKHLKLIHPPIERKCK